ncbi:MAG: thioesterase [Balneolaceae bacterium]
MPTLKHKETFTVRSYEVDYTGRATLPSVANYLQETAGIHASNLSFDIEDLNKSGATWVLYRMRIQMDKFPVRWQQVSVQTWPSSGDGVRAFRDYELLDKNNERLGVGVSQWMVLNVSKRRPMRIPDEILKMGLSVDEHVLPINTNPLPELALADHTTTLRVGSQDLDMNRHVNNVTYIEWMTGYLPEEITKDMRCSGIELQYHRETGLGREITIKSGKTEDGTFIHAITDSDSSELLAHGVSIWE